MQRILMATDFSASAAHALRLAAAIARALGGKIQVVHVLALLEADPAMAEQEMPRFVPDDLESLVESKKIIRATTAELGVIHEAREQNADMIVIGTHGRTGLSHVLLGSVAERVVRLADRPVLTVRAPADAIKEPS